MCIEEIGIDEWAYCIVHMGGMFVATAAPLIKEIKRRV